MKNFISVIVPVYNVKDYLKQCVDSILSQTYQRFEIILVDDGSLDESGALCDEYAKLDSRVQVIHKENGGLSSARNAGIDVATYDLLSFVDSDDYLEPTFLERLVQPFLEDSDVELSCCRYVKSTETKINVEQDKYSVCAASELLNNIYDDTISNLSFVTWNKLYSKRLFESLRFPEGKIHEDEYTTYKAIYYSKKCAIILEQLYIYRIRENSIMTTSVKRRVDCVQAIRFSIDFYKGYHEDQLMKKAIYCYLVQCIHWLKYIEPKKDRKEETKQFKRIARKYAFQLDCSFLKKLYLKFFTIFY
ncbi:MAG: glycosyltransferase [Anaeroplasmataceae bacterium]|nr:glycosyltransferase [Anaeroplasmataceae bacterium]